MNEKYEKLNMVLGGTIDKAVQELLEYRLRGKLASIDFNGTMLYSDTVTVDDAYLQITGETKAQFDAAEHPLVLLVQS